MRIKTSKIRGKLATISTATGALKESSVQIRLPESTVIVDAGIVVTPHIQYGVIKEDGILYDKDNPDKDYLEVINTSEFFDNKPYLLTIEGAWDEVAFTLDGDTTVAEIYTKFGGRTLDDIRRNG